MQIVMNTVRGAAGGALVCYAGNREREEEKAVNNGVNQRRQPIRHHRPRHFRPRVTYLDLQDELKLWIRLDRLVIHDLIEELRPFLESPTARNRAIPAVVKVTCAQQVHSKGQLVTCLDSTNPLCPGSWTRLPVHWYAGDHNTFIFPGSVLA